MIALDTNILIYADTPHDSPGRHSEASALIDKLATGEHFVPIQVLSEFLSVCRKKRVIDLELAIRRVETYACVFETPATTLSDLTDAAQLLSRFTLQYFDALIISVAARAGATMLLSEDMHDGLVIDGLTIVNPFAAGNDAIIAAVLS